MAATIKRLDQQRHELKALRYILEHHPQSLRDRGALPSKADFQIPDNQKIYEALLAAKTKEEAMQIIRSLDLEETELDSFLQLGGEYYYTYPVLIRERGQEFRAGKLKIVSTEE